MFDIDADVIEPTCSSTFAPIPTAPESVEQLPTRKKRMVQTRRMGKGVMMKRKMKIFGRQTHFFPHPVCRSGQVAILLCLGDVAE